MCSRLIVDFTICRSDERRDETSKGVAANHVIERRDNKRAKKWVLRDDNRSIIPEIIPYLTERQQKIIKGGNQN